MRGRCDFIIPFPARASRRALGVPALVGDECGRERALDDDAEHDTAREVDLVARDRRDRQRAERDARARGVARRGVGGDELAIDWNDDKPKKKPPSARARRRPRRHLRRAPAA